MYHKVIIVLCKKRKKKVFYMSNEVLNIASGENQIPVSFTQEPDWEALTFVKEFLTWNRSF